MTRDQLHGKKFEDQIKGSGLFPGSADYGRSVNSKFDVEARFDRRHGLPTSIKSTGSGTVTLADARRFWEIDEPFRLLVGVYAQLPDRKSFHTVHEFIVHEPMWTPLRGRLAFADITEIHVGLGLAAFPRGRHIDARTWAADQLATLVERQGVVRLNPKIDSTAQRRLQCSVKLAGLISLAEQSPQFGPEGGAALPNHVVHKEFVGDLGLPIVVRGDRREFNS